ncbi:MAG: SRPBCC family protein [Cyanobacteria bacterium REEB67]|nr:SRPBCC family protein [Cyanobacteria bacterium REEB67]
MHLKQIKTGAAFALLLACTLGSPPATYAGDKGESGNKADRGQQNAEYVRTSNLAALYEYDPPGVKLSKASTAIVINAPQQFVWDRLVNFQSYPKLFPRLKTCQVVKKEGDLIYIESLLKPQMFVSQPCQHTINDLEDKPDSLKWKLTDGNFKAVEGEWKLRSIDDGQHTEVRYTMEVDPGPLIPRPIIVMALKMVQREAVLNVKASVEEDFKFAAANKKLN